MQLSRKHVIETDIRTRHLTIFGGKLTDCLNVGEEVCKLFAELGLPVPEPKRRWYGEPDSDAREEWFHRARLMELDAMTAAASSEKLSTRLWRRYGTGAFALLESIRADPRDAEVLIENAEYLRCEIEQAARREMVVKLVDFLRRRSKISLVVSRDALTERSARACARPAARSSSVTSLPRSGGSEYFATHQPVGIDCTEPGRLVEVTTIYMPNGESIDPSPPDDSPLPATVRLFGVASLMTDAAGDMIYPLVPLFLTSVLGGSVAELSESSEGVAESTAALLKLVSGKIADRVSRKKPLVLFGYGTDLAGAAAGRARHCAMDGAADPLRRSGRQRSPRQPARRDGRGCNS